MPKTNSRLPARYQPIVLGVLMTLLLAGSLSLCFAVTGASPIPPQNPSLTQVDGLGIAYAVPRSFARDADLEAGIGDAQSRVYRDRRRPTRQMLVRSYSSPIFDPTQFADEFSRSSLVPTPRQDILMLTQDDPARNLTLAIRFGFSSIESDRPGRQHYLVVVNPTEAPGRYWVIYMRDEVLPGEQLRPLLSRNAELMMSIAEEVRLIVDQER